MHTRSPMPVLNRFKASVTRLNAWIMDRVLPILTRRRGAFHSYLLAVVLMVLALWIRLQIAPIESGLQYLTFFPAVAIAAVVGGYGPALLAVALGLVLATYIFTPPYYEISLNSLQMSLWSNGVFLIDGLIVSFSIEAMHRYRKRYTEKLRIAQETEEWLRVASVAFDSQVSMIITDANNVIVRVNKAFTDTTGYSAEEVIGQTPSMFKSGRHDDAFYAAMWEQINRTGSWHGELWDRRKNGEIYPKLLSITAITDPQGNVSHYVGAHTDISERKSAEEQIRYLAFYDPLTQLPNRRLLLDRLHQAINSCARSGNFGALLFIDLDNFKSLNDTMGHDMGDLLLQLVAQRLQSGVRDGDTVARLGGDEFVLMLQGLGRKAIDGATQTELIGEKILASLAEPYQLGTHSYHGSASIGATLFSGGQTTADEIMKQADIAMYQAKKSGRNALCFFDPHMQESINERVSLERELHRALEDKQFCLHYQVQVDQAMRPIGAEALLRWLHPQRGLVEPAEFITLAEESGKILPIGQWVLESACAQLRSWQQNELTQFLSLSINVSAKQFHQSDFVAQIQSALRSYNIDPARLKLELTESMLLENIEETISKMNTLRETGISFSLDDFGTGYSSLRYFKHLPITQLKIDQSFIRDIVEDSSDREIVNTIIAIAGTFNLNVIAEGVETEEQQHLLNKLGCHHYQGYLFNRPVPIEEFEPLLERTWPVNDVRSKTQKSNR